VIQVNEQGRKQMMVALGACQLLSLEDVQQAVDAIQTTRFVMTQLEIPLTVATEAVLLAKQSGAQVLFDPSPPVALPDELLSMVDIIKPDTKTGDNCDATLPNRSCIVRT
jgi:ribokinase